MNLLESAFTNIWNKGVAARSPRLSGGLDLGSIVRDGQISNQQYYLPTQKRAEHIYIRGRTGSGKTRLLLRMCLADIIAGRGFLIGDTQGQIIPLLCGAIAALAGSITDKVILISPSDPLRSIGLNILSQGRNVFIEIAAITETLMHKLGLSHLGVTVQELLRNCLFCLASCGLTIVDLPPFLWSPAFRARCLKSVENVEVREFFLQRFEPLSDAMKNLRREALLNKFSELVADWHFRDILGQIRSTINFDDILATGKIVLLDVPKALLGPHAATFCSLIIQQFAPAIFSRKCRKLFSFYLDEVPDWLGPGIDIDVLLSQARKYMICLCLAHQFEAQLDVTLRGAVAATGTQIFFQQSAPDAVSAAQALALGKSSVEALVNLKARHCFIKSGHYPAREVRVPNVDLPFADPRELITRSLERYTRPRAEIEAEILSRRQSANPTDTEALNDWE